MENSLSRRDFIKAAGVAGGAALIAGALPTKGNTAPSEINRKPDPLLQGICDIHVHAAPDTKPRSITELGFAREAKEAGYRAIMFKSNDWSCHDRAFLIREALPNFECFGSLIMNSVHGNSVNAHAAEQTIKTTGNLCRCIWMPTMSAAYHHKMDKFPGSGIPVLGANRSVLPEVVRVMEICAEANIMFASGHCSPEEALVLAAKAREVGVSKFVVTHANSYIWKMTHDQVRRAVDMGAFIEYSYITNLWGPGTGVPQYQRMSADEFTAYARLTPERSFITTDLGQVNMPHPLNGMRECVSMLQKAGMSQKDIDLLVRQNPAQLLGLDA